MGRRVSIPCGVTTMSPCALQERTVGAAYLKHSTRDAERCDNATICSRRSVEAKIASTEQRRQGSACPYSAVVGSITERILDTVLARNPPWRGCARTAALLGATCARNFPPPVTAAQTAGSACIPSRKPTQFCDVACGCLCEGLLRPQRACLMRGRESSRPPSTCLRSPAWLAPRGTGEAGDVDRCAERFRGRCHPVFSEP